jgi:PIN domain nuclease of toxin-antitoxin system
VTRLLLDTHVWLWLTFAVPGKVRPQAREAVEAVARSGQVLISIASVWEIALLEARRRIILPLPVRAWLVEALAYPGIALIGLVEPGVVIDSVSLPTTFPGDPVDRFLVATARALGATLVTRDERILAFAETGQVQAMAA